MCCNSFRIKPVNPTASKRIFCQCGYCPDCLKAERRQWSFRLQAELLGRQKQGWRTGFFTLTYSDENLPFWRIDEDIDENWNLSENSKIPCFSRSDVRNFILSVRKKLHRDFGVVGISYMICSEFGEHTQRPHYHGIISYPSCVTPEVMHSIVCQFWTKGHVFPRDYRGGVDSHGYHHKAFDVDCVNSASAYCAKYVCKDFGFYRMCLDSGIDVKDRYFRKECAPFHIQSRSLGLSFICDMTDVQKADLLVNGYAFVGSDFRVSCPVYLRNKIVFDTHYVYDIYTHNRLVRRDANDFFKAHKHDIYDAKLRVYTALFDNLKKVEYLENRVGDFFHRVYGPDVFTSGDDVYDIRESFQRSVRLALSLSSERLAEHYLSWYGVPIQFRLFDRVESWFNHLTQFYKITDEPYDSEVDDDVVSTLLLLFKFTQNPESADKDLIEYVKDYHKHME